MVEKDMQKRCLQFFLKKITLPVFQGPAKHYEQWSIFPMELQKQHQSNSRTQHGTLKIYKS